jgi:hypothetical protein
VVLGPPLEDAAIDALERDLGLPLPGERRRLLAVTTTVDGIVDVVDFSGRSLGPAFGLEDVVQRQSDRPSRVRQLLRGSSVGTGFSWGRYGQRTEVRRHGHERIFAVGRPER